MFHPQLFTALEPPEIWIHIGTVRPTTDEGRPVTIRIRCTGQKSVTLRETVDCYAPEWSIFLALRWFSERCSALSESVSKVDLQAMLHDSFVSFVDPF